MWSLLLAFARCSHCLSSLQESQTTLSAHYTAPHYHRQTRAQAEASIDEKAASTHTHRHIKSIKSSLLLIVSSGKQPRDGPNSPAPIPSPLWNHCKGSVHLALWFSISPSVKGAPKANKVGNCWKILGCKKPAVVLVRITTSSQSELIVSLSDTSISHQITSSAFLKSMKLLQQKWQFRTYRF